MSSLGKAASAAQGGAVRKPGALQGFLSLVLACLPLIAFMSLPPAMPRLIAHFSGVKGVAVLAPMIPAAPALCVALFAPLAGWLADRVGRRPLALGAIVVFTLGGLVPFAVDNLWLILAGRLVMGLANSALITLGVTLIGDYFEGPARSRWLAMNGILGSLLISAASLSGGFLADWSWRGPFLLNLIGAPVLLLCALWLFEPPVVAARTAAAPQEAALFPWRSLAGLALMTLVCAVLFYAEAVQIGLMLDQIGVTSARVISVIAAGASLGYPLGAWIYSRIVGRWRSSTMLFCAWTLFGAGLIGMGLSQDFRLTGLFGFTQQIGAGIVLTGLINECYERFPLRVRALSAGVWMSAFFSGQFASPLAVAAVAGLAGGLRPAVALFGLPPLAFALFALGRRPLAPIVPAAPDLA